MPGSDERKLKSSLSLAADCLVYDLEDGVAHNRKNIAREMVFDALEASEHRKAEKAVRINAVGSGLEFDDLNVVVIRALYDSGSHAQNRAQRQYGEDATFTLHITICPCSFGLVGCKQS